jgi:hypothetical protein
MLVIAGALLTLTGTCWIAWLLGSRPSIGGFSGGVSESCYAVFDLPRPGASEGDRHDLDDQARLNHLQPSDQTDGPRLADDCARARTSRVATASVIATPLTLIVLTGTVTGAMALRRASRLVDVG